MVRKKVGINGFGRIGRNLFRIIKDNYDSIQLQDLSPLSLLKVVYMLNTNSRVSTSSQYELLLEFMNCM